MFDSVQRRAESPCYKHVMDPRPSVQLPPPQIAQLMQRSDYVRAEFGAGPATELSRLYQALAALCVQKKISRVLVVAADDDPAGEHALRNALVVLMLEGLPPRFKLALVATTPQAAVTYRNAQRGLCAAGITTRLFESEPAAACWLESGLR